jgi:hypothetical protein
MFDVNGLELRPPGTLIHAYRRGWPLVAALRSAVMLLF